METPIHYFVLSIATILTDFEPTKNLDEDADNLADVADIFFGTARTLMVDGVRALWGTSTHRPGVLVGELLTVKGHQFLHSPAYKAAKSASLTPPSPVGSDANVALVQAFTDSLKGLRSASRPDTDHNQAKIELMHHKPSFWIDIHRKQYGARFIPCPEYAAAVNTAPLDPRSLTAPVL